MKRGIEKTSVAHGGWVGVERWWWVEMRSETWAVTRFPGPVSPLGVEWQAALWIMGGREAREKAGRPVWRPSGSSSEMG